MSVDAIERTVEERSDESNTHSPVFRLARLLFGGVLAFMALDNFRSLEDMIGYAESQGAPMAEATVPAISGTLLFGGAGIATWTLPRLAAGAAATFFAAITPVMHDFWSIDDEEASEQQQIHFLKNTALLGGALAFLKIADDD